MNQTEIKPEVKILSPALHFYYYVLRNGINESPETLKQRREFLEKNLNNITSHLTSRTGKKGKDIIKLIPIEQDLTSFGTILNFNNIPEEYLKNKSDRLYFETGLFNSRLAVRRLNDTYFLRLTRYVSSSEGEQRLNVFDNLCEYLNKLEIELGKTGILAGIINAQDQEQDLQKMAVRCLSSYHNKSIPKKKIIINKFLDSPFYIYEENVAVKRFNNYPLQAKNISCVFFYKDDTVEQKANNIYSIFQNLFLSYHKINYFYSQSRILKEILSKQRDNIENKTENYTARQWDNKSLVKLPQESLKYYKQLSFLEDQAKLIEVHQINYQNNLKEIEQKTGEQAPQFFLDFAKNINSYLEQIKADIGFLNSGIELYEKLMLSIQTQVSVNEAAIQERQAKLGQLLTGVGTTLAVGQMIAQPITETIHLYYDRGKTETSLATLWYSAIGTISLSIIVGYIISIIIYQWFTKDKF